MKTVRHLVIILPILLVTSLLPIFSPNGFARNKDKGPNLSRILVSSPFFLRTCIEDVAKVYKRNKRATEVTVVIDEPEEENTKYWKKPTIKLAVRVQKNGKKVWNTNQDVNATHGVRVGFVGLSIYKNRENPLKGLTIPQIDAIFSKDRFCGFPFTIRNMGQLGLTDVWLDRPVLPFGTAASPEVLAWFQNVCLCNGHFAKRVKLLATKVDLFQALSTQPSAIGFYLSGVKEKYAVPLAISKEEGEDYYYPTKQNIESGRYPLSGEVIALFEKREVSAADMDFLKFCLSKRGQDILKACRLIPVYPRGYTGRDLPIERLKGKGKKH